MNRPLLLVSWMALAGCSDYGDVRRAVYDSSLVEYSKAWARHRDESARHKELVQNFDASRSRGESPDEQTRSLGAQWEVLREDAATLAEIDEREKTLLNMCKQSRLPECASDESFKTFLERYRIGAR